MQFWHDYGKLFFSILAFFLALTLIYNFLQTPQYEATARVVVEKQNRPVLPTQDNAEGRVFRDADIVDTEVEILHSAALAQRVAEKLDLINDPDFSSGLPNKTSDISVVKRLMELVKIQRVGKTYLIDVLAQSSNAEQSAKIANSYVQEYLDQQADVKQKATQRTNDLLAERLASMAAKVENAERAVQQFKIANDQMSVNGATLAEQSITAIDNELALAKADERAANGRLQARLASGANLDAGRTSALEQMIAQQALAEQEWRQAEKVFGRKHPSYTAARTRAEELQQAVVNERQKARNAFAAERQTEIDRLQSEARATSAKRASLSRSVGKTRQTLAQANAAQVRLNGLQRNADAVRATYEAYLSRYQETTTQIGSEQPDARIVSPAMIPAEPSFPNWPLTMAFGVLLGLAAAFSVVIAKIGIAARSDLKD